MSNTLIVNGQPHARWCAKSEYDMCDCGIELTNAERYASHKWKSERQMTDYGTGTEYVTACEECGMESQGDPAEFPDFQYPICQKEPIYGIVLDRVTTQPTFNDLRQMAQHPRLRPLIDQRKDRIAPAPWAFEAESKYLRDHDTIQMCNRLRDMFAEPDGITPFQNWVRIALEDMFVVGAPAVFIYRGIDKVFFRLIDAASIGLVRDENGKEPPLGTPFAAQMTGDEPVFMTDRELLYAIRHPHKGTVYGESLIERVAAREHEAAQSVLKESKDGAIFHVFEPLIGSVDEDREWFATQVIDKLVERVFGETNCRFRWNVE